MNELTVFTNEQFGSIRTMTVDGEPWFIGKDVAAALGYKNTSIALQDNVDDADKGVAKVTTLGGTQNATIINESGLYCLVFGSKLPGAKQFKRWITHDVIPSIRKTGGYIAGQETMTDAELMAKALIVANRQIEERQKRIDSLEEKAKLNAPKVLFASAVETSKASILIGKLAKILKQNGIGNMGQNRLFEWLRNHGYLIGGNRADYNMPTQKSMELGLFEIKETTVTHADGHITLSKTPKITGKGQVYFINKFLNKGEPV